MRLTHTSDPCDSDLPKHTLTLVVWDCDLAQAHQKAVGWLLFHPDDGDNFVTVPLHFMVCSRCCYFR